MKLGDTRFEMQKNYSHAIKTSRKVGKVLACIGAVSSLVSLVWLIQLLNTNAPIGAEHLLLVLFVITCPISGYIAGHLYYYAFKRMASWLEALETGNSSESGCLFFLIAFGGLGTMIAWVICIGLFFSAGIFIGLYDWIKIHIDGKRYGLKVQ